MAVIEKEILELELVARLSKDLREAATKLKDYEVRFLVDTYYQIQDYRCQLGNQMR